MFTAQKEQDAVFVLASPRDDGSIAILCRTSGSKPGPAFCDSKKDAVSLKTRLANDPRGMGNHRSLEIIKSLYIYKISTELKPAWEPGLLWAYLPAERALCVEKL